MGSYYVATTGSNSNPGTITQPWRTIAYAVGGSSALGAGDTLYIRAGTYDEVVDIEVSGTSGNLITIRNYPGETVTLTDTAETRSWKWQLFDQSYLTLYGLTWSNYTGGALYVRAYTAAMTQLTLENCTFQYQDYLSSGEAKHCVYWVATNSSYPMSWITAKDNTFYDIATTQRDNNYSSDVMTATGHVSYILYEGNSIDTCTGIGLNLVGTTSGCPEYAVIKDNVLTNWATRQSHRAAGIYNDGAGGHVVIENNELYDGELGITVSMERSSATKRGQYFIVRNNTVYRSWSHIILGGGWNEACSAIFYPTDIACCHNTVYNTGPASAKCAAFYCGEEILLRNNIWAENTSDGVYIYSVSTASGLSYSTWESDYNIHFYSGTAWWRWGSTYTSLAAFQAGASQDANSLSSDPLFVDAANGDFSLDEGSPAIDAGGDLTTTDGAGSGTTVTVHDSRWFSDGMGIQDGDTIRIGSNPLVMITGIDYATHEITVDTSITWGDGDAVNYDYVGSGPDIGAVAPAGEIAPAVAAADAAVVDPQVIAGWPLSVTPDPAVANPMVADPTVLLGVVAVAANPAIADGVALAPSLSEQPPVDTSRMIQVPALDRVVKPTQAIRDQPPSQVVVAEPDVLDMGFDFVDWLAADEELVDALWTIPGGLDQGDDYLTETKVMIWLSGWTEGNDYEVLCEAFTSLGKEIQWALTISCRAHSPSLITASPEDLLDYQFNWELFLGEDDTVSAMEFTVPVGLTLESQWKTDTVTTVLISGGVTGTDYEILCEMDSGYGRTKEWAFTLNCEEW